MASLQPEPEVTIVEVAPRDGLQNQKSFVPTSSKIAFINALAEAGFRVIEATSFVHPHAVPQLADAEVVMSGIQRESDVRYLALVPNERGLERALNAGVESIALFLAATEEFSQANISCSIHESFNRAAKVLRIARGGTIWVRGYVSVAFNCPYSGPVAAADAADIASRLFEAGCDEICLADTIGTGTVDQVKTLLWTLIGRIPRERTAMHFHDTYGRAIDNVAAAHAAGVRIFDSAAGGLGGCPFAPGAPGNLATERLVGYFRGRGIETGVDLSRLRKSLEILDGLVVAPETG
jgi:hydroxymethylglutaryl-CoA lyase